MKQKFIEQNIKKYQIEEFMDEELDNAGHSHTEVKDTPMGEKIIIYASKPGLVVGKGGSNIKDLTEELKNSFDLEDPQIEVEEVEEEMLDSNIVCEKVVSSLERFGSSRFKGIGHKMADSVMDAGAQGVEIIMSGKIPGSRARTWRFSRGYVKKCGDAAQNSVKQTTKEALLKAGTVGIKVKIMPPGIELPDDVEWIDEEEIKEETEVDLEEDDDTEDEEDSEDTESEEESDEDDEVDDEN